MSRLAAGQRSFNADDTRPPPGMTDQNNDVSPSARCTGSVTVIAPAAKGGGLAAGGQLLTSACAEGLLWAATSMSQLTRRNVVPTHSRCWGVLLLHMDRGRVRSTPRRDNGLTTTTRHEEFR
jgi:hypothetical protein